jgi:Na+/H+ antiporter NhaD/arsenite permease-like protein
VVSLIVLTVVTAAFVLHTVLHLQPSVVAIVGGLTLLAASKLDASEVAKWSGPRWHSSPAYS